MDLEEMGKEVSKKVADLTQSAVVKGKELTETAKIMLNVRSAKDKIRAAQQRLGEYVAANRLFTEDETVNALYREMDGFQEEVRAGENRMRILKNEAICPGCGAVLPLTQLFCDKCGTKMPQPVCNDPITDFVENEAAPAVNPVDTIVKNVASHAASAAAPADDSPAFAEVPADSENTPAAAEPEAPKADAPTEDDVPEMKFPWE